MRLPDDTARIDQTFALAGLLLGAAVLLAGCTMTKVSTPEWTAERWTFAEDQSAEGLRIVVPGQLDVGLNKGGTAPAGAVLGEIVGTAIKAAR